MTTQVLTYVSPEQANISRTKQLADFLGFGFMQRQTIPELFPLLSDPKFSTDLIIIDVDKFCKVEGTTLYDIMHSLSTLIKCTVSRPMPGIPTKRNTVLAAGASMYTDPSMLKEMLSICDIKGIVPNGDEFAMEEKKHAVLELISGKIHIPTKIQKILLARKKSIKSNNLEIDLTPRQHQIVDLVTNRGASNKIIAKILNITESTVKLHLGAIYKKYGVKNRTQLAVFGRK